MLQEDNTIKIPQNLHVFAGHFEDNPIVPGIYSLELAVCIMSRFLKKEVTLEKIIRCKFTTPLVPSMELTSKVELLSIENDLQKARVQFWVDDTVTVDIKFVVKIIE
ncbi:3-hydroxyacyl-[acyl-carrier-protein] dehydratase FabZ [Candidatus Uabimicrobium amorphum]|uniref:3-hydroxyacyl-[acyl-carrier-protein] dehydratase FabZ n=2 Tax=Uabimicrobium amorphum TaxID=2596890 RepID=A0A5S9IPC6_UABAM|nr:3-hydroxyacyl-[acyl-carrier-protein] dehydratase FabZ [Candidatus Uabimicrobium amorphum]